MSYTIVQAGWIFGNTKSSQGMETPVQQYYSISTAWRLYVTQGAVGPASIPIRPVVRETSHPTYCHRGCAFPYCRCPRPSDLRQRALLRQSRRSRTKLVALMRGPSCVLQSLLGAAVVSSSASVSAYHIDETSGALLPTRRYTSPGVAGVSAGTSSIVLCVSALVSSCYRIE